jgi:segregation and condensation protein B
MMENSPESTTLDDQISPVDFEFTEVESIIPELPLEMESPELDVEISDEEDREVLEFQLDYLDEEKQEDHLWQARTGLNPDTLCGAIETIIFMSEKPISIVKIRGFIDPDLPLRVVHESISRLQEGYEQSLHGLRLVEVAEGYQFRTKATYSKYVQDIFKVSSLVLTPTALEVLAIIAYKQPVSKTEVDKIRGVDSGHLVRVLMEKRLVKIVGRSEDVGRPVIYGTTLEFLEVFNLSSISQLPPEYEIQEMAEQSQGHFADIKTLVSSNDKSKFVFDEIEELDELSESIKAISSDTPFTRSLTVEEKRRTSEEGAVIKTAFEILEEFVNNEIVSEQNRNSNLSELIMAAIAPKVISDLTEGPFNIPQSEDEDDFQMIDLETGEALAEDLLFPESAIDRSLEDALDHAVSKLDDYEEIDEDSSEIDEKVKEIDQLTEQMIAKGDGFDLDLSFLKEECENNSEYESEYDTLN